MAIRANSSRDIRKWSLYGSILGCEHQSQGLWKRFGVFPSEQTEVFFAPVKSSSLVNSWDAQIITNKFGDELRTLILLLFKHEVCVLAYFA